jgi:hypothetical protein
MHSGLLGLAHRLLYLEPLPFNHVSSGDCELMQLKTVSESSPQMQMPSCDHLTIYSSPQVTLVHLTADQIPFGLRVTGQELPKKLVRLGNSLVVSLPGFLKHLLGLAKLQLAGLLLLPGTQTHEPTGLWMIL